MGEYHSPTPETEQPQTIAGYNNAALHHPPSHPDTREEELSFYKIAKP